MAIVVSKIEDPELREYVQSLENKIKKLELREKLQQATEDPATRRRVHVMKIQASETTRK